MPYDRVTDHNLKSISPGRNVIEGKSTIVIRKNRADSVAGPARLEIDRCVDGWRLRSAVRSKNRPEQTECLAHAQSARGEHGAAGNGKNAKSVSSHREVPVGGGIGVK